MKKVLSLLLSIAVIIGSFAITTTASAAYLYDIDNAPEIVLNQPRTDTFKYGYPDGTLKSSTFLNSAYYKFTPATTGYYEFDVTGYKVADYVEGYSPLVSLDVKDETNKTIKTESGAVFSTSTKKDTLITRKAGILQKGQTYYVFVFTTMASLKNYKASSYGYAEQNLTVKVTNHTHSFNAHTTSYTNYSKASYTCAYCGFYKYETFYKPSTMSISKSSFVYNGKVQKPAVTAVKDSNGKQIAQANYRVSYSNASSKNVNKYTVKVTFLNEYASFAPLTASYTIKPVATTLSSVTAQKKGFKAKWAKKTAQVSGYQIRYSTKQNMSGAKTVTIAKNNTVTKSVTKLATKKKYYVQVRTYQTAGGTKYYSAWSKSKAVTTKK